MNALAWLAAASLAAHLTGATPLSPQTDTPAERRRDLAYTVDPMGSGDFVDLATAVATVPRRSLLILKPGSYAGVRLNRKSLRIESEVPHAARITGPLVIESLGPRQSIYLSGLFFEDAFRVQSCAGEVSFFGCRDEASGLSDVQLPCCYCVTPCTDSVGTGSSTHGCVPSRHTIEDCNAVCLVDCELNGRDGFPTGVDGASGESAIEAVNSIVAIYGGSYMGGDGGSASPSLQTFAGSGGDGCRGRGSLTRVRRVGGVFIGGQRGHSIPFEGCSGVPVAMFDGAVATVRDHDCSLALAPLARPGTMPVYVIHAPVGATVLLKVGSRRAWREFPSDVGVFHIAPPFATFALGTVDSSGVLTGTLPAPWTQWRESFQALELQAQATLGGQDRFSEPRTLHVTSVQ